MDSDTKRPRLKQQPTGDRLEAIKEDLQQTVDSCGVSDSRFIGPNGKVTDDKVILEGLKRLRRAMNNGEIDL